MPSTRSRLIGHFGVLVAADLVVRLLSLATGVVSARVLGPAELGAVSVALALLSYASVLGDGGLTTLTQLRLVAAHGRDDQLVSTTLAIQLGLSLLLGAGLTVVVWLLPLPAEVRTLTALGLPLLAAQALNVFFVVQVMEQMRLLAGLRVAMQVVTTAACLLGFAAGLRGSAAVASLWIGLVAVDVATWVSLSRGGRIAPARPSAVQARSLVRGAPVYLAAMVLTQLLTNADIVVIGLSRPERDTGDYAAAFRLVGSLQLAVVVLVTAVFPELARRATTDPEAAASLVRRLVRLSARPGFAACALVIPLAGPLTRTLYGAGYHATGPLLAIMMLFVPLGYYNSVLAQALVASGNQGDHLRVIAVTTVLAVAGLLVFVPSWGPRAAAVVLVAREVVSIVGLTVAVQRRLGSSMLATLTEQLPFLVVPGLAAWGVSRLTDGSWPLVLAAGMAGIAVCEGAARHRLVAELRGIPVRPRGQSR